MWNILPSDDERMIAEAAREFLVAELPLERLRPKPVRAIAWDEVSPVMGNLGWFAVGLPEAAGGSGLGLVEEMLISREFARQVASTSTLGLVLAAHLCAEAGDADRAADFASGARSAAVALVSDNGEAYVFDWREGDPVVAWTAKGIGLFEGEALAGLREEQCLDESLTLHAGKLALGRPLHWRAATETTLIDRARILLAAALCGLAEQACELTVDYAKIREQFGVAIGSFQAVKHRCADMGVRARLAWYQTNVAALKVAVGTDDAGLALDSALLLAAEAAHENGRAGIQMHGGIGFQAECDIHWFMKRAHVYDRLAGGRLALARQVLSHPLAA